ncbi:MAG TPA: YaiI/YqxD family protein [Gammaproteobacteria bacterium]
MQIWVDADACPVVIKEIIFRAAERRQVQVTLVANKLLGVPRSPFIRAVRVASGFDEADNYIAANVTSGDLVISADIPLAAAVIEKGGHALTPRGERYTSETIRQKLTMRDFMDQLRGSGIQIGGPAALSQRDRKAFGDELDRFLAQALR